MKFQKNINFFMLIYIDIYTNLNKIYFPKKYLKEILEKDFCKIIRKDIFKISKSYMNNKINQGLIAINNINNI